ncbi:hypothetical protein BUALT_Bualt13G0078600 [Buddleja alternifolia]|uniref:MLO-like protein n=1 Tax=Buddleja alternifolia TaxID=168488 RepID=A0AAV6WWH2_9LAMI|nr:hypothetical protein BUALT_Bualt13G0078600 [Buddleja alternifolia]
MAAGEGGINRSLQETPTWALATVCFIFIFLGIFIEHLIHLAGHWLKKHKKAALYEATEKLKSVLMQLGFMSLILTVTQRSISKICIPNKVAYSMLPCRRSTTETKTSKALEHLWISFSQKAMSQQPEFNVNVHHERALAAATSDSIDHCGSKGMTSLMSQEGINQLNIFIFVLAAMQIVYSIATMGLGRAKMKRWKTWEKATQTVEYMAENDSERFRLARQTTFGRRHVSSCAENLAQLWIAHLSTNNSFNFRKYIQRSLEDDFRTVIGVSPIMWFIAVIFLLADVHGWNVFLWVSFLPLIIVLFLGTKLEVIMARMAMQITDQNTVIKGTPLVKPNNNLFWFKRPQLVLTLIHFVLFMNAFEFAFFIWVTWQFGIRSCYHDNVEIIVIRVVLAKICGGNVLFENMQMGSEYKSAILEEHTIHAIKQWHSGVKQMKRPKREAASDHDFSISHHRAPTFTEFASINYGEADEITEEIEIYQWHDHQEDQSNHQHFAQSEIECDQRV